MINTQYTYIIYPQSTCGDTDEQTAEQTAHWTGSQIDGWMVKFSSIYILGMHSKYIQYTYIDTYPAYIHSIHPKYTHMDRWTNRWIYIYSTYTHDSIHTIHSIHTWHTYPVYLNSINTQYTYIVYILNVWRTERQKSIALRQVPPPKNWMISTTISK